MGNYRLSLIFSAVLLSLLVWQAWQADYVIPQQQKSSATSESTDLPILMEDSTIDRVDDKHTEELPQVQVEDDTPVSTIAKTVTKTSVSNIIHVMTDLYQIDIDTRGGSVIRVLLNNYPTDIDVPEVKYELMGTDPSNYFISQSGLLAADKVPAPDHKSIYKAELSTYEMQESADSLEVALVWEKSGIRVVKTFTFTRGDYLIGVSHQLENNSLEAWKGRQYRQLMRSEPAEQPGDNGLLVTYTGAAYYSPEEHYQKEKFDNIQDEKLSVDVVDGWIAMLQHYYLAAWVPNRDEKNHFYTNVTNQNIQPRYVIGAYSPAVKLEPGEKFNFTSGFLAGPKLQYKLEEIATGLELSVDYTFLTLIAKPIFWALTKIHNVVGNWGWAIIFLTIVIKMMFFHLSAKSYRSMANMRKLTPRIQAMKERYTDDKAGMNQAMMELYKKEKVNPLGGCLPILVQIPVFISLYWVLLEAVELRHAPFIFWLNDLSEMDPYFILPLLMGVSMFIQQKLNPQPPDPMQAKIMMSLPFVFTIFFAFFPSGLVLYWVVNNILSISQQWYITQKIEKAS